MLVDDWNVRIRKKDELARNDNSKTGAHKRSIAKKPLQQISYIYYRFQSQHQDQCYQRAGANEGGVCWTLSFFVHIICQNVTESNAKKNLVKRSQLQLISSSTKALHKQEVGKI